MRSVQASPRSTLFRAVRAMLATMSTKRRTTKKPEAEKPRFMLIPPDASAEQLAVYFEALTGRKVSAKQIAAEKAKRGEK